MHPIQRIFISLVTSLLACFLLPFKMPVLNSVMLAWVIFSLSYLILSLLVIIKRPVSEIRKTAKKNDGSVLFVSALILLSSFASMFTVLLLMLSQKNDSADNVFYLPLAISGMMLSWLMVHSIYTFHYAHMYYDDDKEGKDAGGLDFPGEAQPNYIDFAYFSFVIGCTFQVSDVEISSPKIRRVALLHGLLSFGLNTFVVALTINIIGSLSN
jgi:uncharacterized membrane protein